MFSASTKSGKNPTGGGTDPQFNYVTILLHGDGTNGAQNNTFLDSSTNNFTITRNGNTTQGSFSPYGSNWSNYFDGNGDYLNVSGATAYGSGSFCFEAWIYSTNVSLQQMVIANATSGGFFVGINVNSSNVLGIGRANVAIDNEVSYTWANNTWYHIAVNRSGTSVQFFVNGTQVGATGSNSINYSTSGRQIGAELNGTSPFNGYISNLRCVNASVYTSTFTPSTTPLTAITSTTLLTCQSNRFVDNSTNNYAITIAGNTSVQRFNPFGASTAYSTSVIGGSGYFDGSGDYLSFPVNTAMVFGTGDFTVEAWVYPTATPGDGSGPIAGVTGNILFGYSASELSGSWGFGVNFVAWQYSFNQAPILNTWQHLAVSRSGTTLKLFFNGVLKTTVTTSSSYTLAGGGRIGDNGSGGYFSGYMTNIRATNTAVYTAAFTPPTAPLTAISGTGLLINATNGAIFDNAMMNDLETVGNAQISTSVKKYGTGSLYFDGNDYLVSNSATTNLYAFGSGDFTIELWIYFNSLTADRVFYDSRNGSNGVYPTIYTTSGNLYYYVSSANRITGGSVSTSTWYHIAVCRSGTSTKMFVNGTQVGSTYTDSNNYLNGTQRPMIGADGNAGGGSNGLDGYIDDIRITKGYARYTANFTAPTAAFPNTGPI
jgi:hypothetical protein